MTKPDGVRQDIWDALTVPPPEPPSLEDQIIAAIREWALAQTTGGNYVVADTEKCDPDTDKPLPGVFYVLDGTFEMTDLARRIDEIIPKEAE